MTRRTVSPPAMSRTRPTKTATPPTLALPAGSAANSRPTSKSSRWMRIMASAARHRREDRDLVAGAHGMMGLGVFPIDRDAHDARSLQRLRVSAAPPLQPFDQ